MRRRWREISTAEIRALVRTELEDLIPRALSDHNLIVEMVAEELAEKGQILDASQKAHMIAQLGTKAGADFLSERLLVAQQIVGPAINVVFSHLEAQFDQITENTISTGGVLSLTDDPLNEQMWSHYAEQGRGFVVGLKAQHPFFTYEDGQTRRHLLKKVIYTDSHIENFWRNPYYLFLVKGTGWSYENEWRMFKRLNSSDDIVSTVTPAIHLWNLPLDLIETIHFGRQYDGADMANDIASLSQKGAKPMSFKTEVNKASGKLEERRLA